MATPATVLSELREALEDDSTLSDYIKGVFLGVRENLVDFPCIVLEPLRLEEVDDSYSSQRLLMRVAVICYLKTLGDDKQLVGTANDRGVLDVENDVKKALSADRRLDENVIHLRFIETTYDFELFPVRNCSIEIEVKFQQTSTTRT